jgi:membrane protein YqaA with SNARE-associated domain
MWVAWMLGFLYPAYVTVKLVGANTDEKDEESKFWLKYWMVYGVFYVSETVLIDVFRMIPHYYLLKIAMLAWLIHPETQGASVVYEKTVRAGLKKCEAKIDEKVEKLKKTLDYKAFVKNTVVPMTKEAAKKTMQMTSGTIIRLMSSTSLSTEISQTDISQTEISQTEIPAQ